MSKTPEPKLRYHSRPRRGEILAHNHVTHTRTMKHGINGFRWFSMPLEPGWEVCPCGWRPDLGVHYARAGHVEWWRDIHQRLGSQDAVDRYIEERAFGKVRA